VDNLGRLRIFREKPGVISPGHIWVGMYDCYMHYNESLWKLVWEMVTQYRDDHHLVG